MKSVKNLVPGESIVTSRGMRGIVVRVHAETARTSVVLNCDGTLTEWQTPSLTDVEVL